MGNYKEAIQRGEGVLRARNENQESDTFGKPYLYSGVQNQPGRLVAGNVGEGGGAQMAAAGSNATPSSKSSLLVCRQSGDGAGVDRLVDCAGWTDGSQVGRIAAHAVERGHDAVLGQGRPQQAHHDCCLCSLCSSVARARPSRHSLHAYMHGICLRRRHTKIPSNRLRSHGCLLN